MGRRGAGSTTLLMIPVLAVGAVFALVGLGVLYAYWDDLAKWLRRPRRDRKVRLRFSTRRRQWKLRKAGREAEEALRQFHNTKKRIRIESRRGWEDMYNELRDKLEPGMFAARRRHKAVDYYQGKPKGKKQHWAHTMIDNIDMDTEMTALELKTYLMAKGIY